MHDETEYSKAFRNYLRSGIDAGLEALADPDGGYIAPPSMADQIMQGIFDLSPFRRLAAVETILTDAMTVLDKDQPDDEEWAPEVIGVTTHPLVGKRSIPVHELYAQPKATQKLVVDSAVDIETWISGKVSEIFARKESEAFINGGGVGQPHGILPCAQRGQIAVTRSGKNGEVTPRGVIDLHRSLPEKFTKRAWFIMNRSTVQSVRLLQNPAGGYLWQPGLAAGAPDTLAGVPVHVVNDMPHAARDSLSVAVGDFQAGYQIVDRSGIRTLRDPFTDRPFVKFFTTKRVGGDVINPNAIKVMALAA